MTCPVCGGETHVLDSRPDSETVRRRRECTTCGYRFTTKEVDVDQLERLQKLVARARDTTKKQLEKLKSLIEQAETLIN